VYTLIKPLLFRLDPERAHDVVLAVLAAISQSDLLVRSMRRRRREAGDGTGFMGLTVPNRVGLAAGLDKDGRAFPALRALGFGWIEVGTVTPRPQPGNARPRLFRLDEDRALINRMGFNSRGIEELLRNITRLRSRYDSVLGINIGKNARTSLENAAEDYLYALEAVHPFADYIAVNISSPNTQALRELQHAGRLESLLDALSSRRDALAGSTGRQVPIAVKLSPDLPEDELQPVCTALRGHGIDGVIASNTTTSRPPGLVSRHKDEAGGLSGRPVETLSTHLVGALRGELGPDVPIIGVGGVEDAATAARKLSAGATALQCYTAFIYQGPRLVQRLAAMNRW